jgi:5S rRNA maturation endonuclease (ribonuclease M5)
MTMLIRGTPVDIDVRTELEAFNWTRPRWSSDKLIAASPFRYDQTPSFFVRLEPYGDYPAGTWSDSGAYDSEWQSGNFVKLLAFLRNETYEETEEYLLANYGAPTEGEAVKLRPIRLKLQRVRQTLKDEVLKDFTQDYSYLKSRGISEEVQRQAGVLFNPQAQAAVIPWRLADGRLANVKYRKTRGKVFWYERGAWPIRELVFGLDRVGPTTVLCEAEIDALSFRQAGFAAIAVGGASFNDFKRDLILRSPIEELVIATDNDKAGEKLRREVESALSGKLRLRHAHINKEVKDANEALVRFGAEALRDAVERSEKVAVLRLNVR